MDNHDTHRISETSKEEHGYKYDNFGNVIVESLDDLIYDRFLEVKQKKKKVTNTKKFIKKIIDDDENEKNGINDGEKKETEKKNNNRKSLIKINIIENPQSENEESEKDNNESQRENEDKNLNGKYKKETKENNGDDSGESNNENNNDVKNKNINNKNKINFHPSQNVSQNESSIVNQNTGSNPQNISPKSRFNFNLNYSDDPIFNIKKVTDLKKMYNKKCFISTNQAGVVLNAVTETKKEPKPKKIRKYFIDKQSGQSISPTKKSKLIYDSSDDDYDVNEEIKNFTINKLNPFVYYGKRSNDDYYKNLRLRLSDIKDDMSKTDDKFLDSGNIKENMRKNSYLYEKRNVDNTADDRKLLNNVKKEEVSFILKKKKKKIEGINKETIKEKQLLNNNDNRKDIRTNAGYGNGKNINNEHLKNNYEKDYNNSLLNENNRNINKLNDDKDKEKNSKSNKDNKNINKFNGDEKDKEKNSNSNKDNKNINKLNDDEKDKEKNSTSNEDNKNINKNKNNEQEIYNIINKENNKNINNDKNDNEENESINNSKEKKITNNNSNNNNKYNDTNSNDEFLGVKNENLNDKKLDNNSKLGENLNHIINNKKNNKDISKFNSEDTKNNFNYGESSKFVLDNKNESTNFGNILNPESNINPNNMDSTFNEKGQKSNTKIYINENNLDNSDNKIFKEDRTFKSINVYMKKPKEIKTKSKENDMDKIEEDFINELNLFYYENPTNTRKRDILNSDLDIDFDTNQDISKKENKQEKIINKIYDKEKIKQEKSKEDINKKENRKNNIPELELDKTNGIKAKEKIKSIKTEQVKHPNFEKDNNNVISGIEMENSNDNASVKSLVVKVNININSKNNSSFSDNLIQDNININNDIIKLDKNINNKENIKTNELNPNFENNKNNFNNISQNEDNIENNKIIINNKKSSKENDLINNNNKENNNEDKFNTEFNEKLLTEKIKMKKAPINKLSKDDEEIILNKPVLTASYLKKVRKDMKMNPKPAKLNRVFISKAYTNVRFIINKQQPIIIPKIDICYTKKFKKIINLGKKIESYRKTILTDYCFFTKIEGIPLQKEEPSIVEDEVKQKKKKKKKKKAKKPKKNEDLDESYISVSVDSKNIFPNNKFKEDFLLKNEFLAQNFPKDGLNKKKNNRTISNTKKNHLNLKDKDKFEIKNNNNETLSSIGNVSNNELNDENDKDNKDQKIKDILKRGKELHKENNDKDKNNNSTRIRVHKYNRKDSNIKIKIRNPKSPNIEYQQIEFNPGTKDYKYKIVKKNSNNNFRRNKNIIQAKDKNETNNFNSIQIKSPSLKPLKINSNQNTNLIISQNNNNLNNINNKSFDNQINIILNKEHHMVGYERHFGKEANCPLCKNMKKKNLFMEEKIFGNKKININKPSTANPNKNRYELSRKIKNKFKGGQWREEEKNLNNNYYKDLNKIFTGQNKNKMKPNIFRDMQRKNSAVKNRGIKYMFKNPTENNNLFKRNSLGNFNELEFPAINSYFHS